MRKLLVILAAVLAAFTLGQASAQPVYPNWTFLKDSAGDVWLIYNNVRVGIPIRPASDDEINALPFSDRWLLPPAEGETSVQLGPRPDWAQSGQPAVAELPPAEPASAPADPPPPPPAPVARPAAAVPPTAAPTATRRPTQTPRPIATSAPPPQVAQDDPITFKGSNSQNTKPFALQGGNYIAKWQVSFPRNWSSCYFGVRLIRVSDGRSVETISNAVINADKSKSDETRLYNIRADRYYLDVSSSSCEWSVTIAPQ